MNPLREAAISIHAAEAATPGLAIRMVVFHKYVHIVGRRCGLEVARSTSWDEIELAKCNVLTTHVSQIVEQLAAAL